MMRWEAETQREERGAQGRMGVGRRRRGTYPEVDLSEQFSRERRAKVRMEDNMQSQENIWGSSMQDSEQVGSVGFAGDAERWLLPP